MAQIIQLARLYGWRVAHFRPAWSKDGKRCMTAVQADGKGFPDLVLVKRCRLLFAEVKVKSRLSPEQQEWIDALTNCMRCEMYVWKPENWNEIQEILTREMPTL